MSSNTIICLTYHKSDEKQQKLIFYGSTHSHKRSQNLSVWTLEYLNWGSVFFYCGRPLPLLNRYGKAGSEFCTFCTLQSLKTDFGSCDLSSYWHNQLIDIKAVIHLYTPGPAKLIVSIGLSHSWSTRLYLSLERPWPRDTEIKGDGVEKVFVKWSETDRHKH